MQNKAVILSSQSAANNREQNHHCIQGRMDRWKENKQMENR